nr:reverse transcriptase domain-containing protein [Tanacetum cinerariifolium]
MSAMANTTPIVTTITKPVTNPRDADATPRVNIQDFGKEYNKDILPIIMDKVCHDKRKEVHVRPDRTSSMDHSRGRNHPHRLDAYNVDHPENRECFCGVGKSYYESHSSYKTWINHGYRYHDRDRSRHIKRGRDSESPLSSVDPFTPRICNFKSSRKTRMPNNVKTYVGIGDPEDHVKIFQATAQVERWPIPTWCHILNSTLIEAARVWFNELPPESIDSYKDLKAAFLANFMQQKKYVKDPVEIYNIKQNDEETIEDFMERFKVETGHMKAASECMRISRFMHGVNNLELTKRLNEHVPNTMKEMMITTTTFIRGEAAAASKKKGHTSWRAQDQTPKEILAVEVGKFQPPPPMVTPVEKKSSNMFCDFHNDKGHSTDECMQLKKQIEELVRARKLSYLIKEIKHGEITFPSLATSSGAEGPLVIEAKIGGHMIHRMYVDEGSSTEALGNNRRRRSFHKSMDEFHDCKHYLDTPECAMVITSFEVPKEAGVRHENFKVALHLNFPDQEVAIRGMLSVKRCTYLCSRLKENLDIFAWQPSDMTRVPRLVAEHRLNIQEGYSPVRQKKMGQASKRANAIQAEVQKLVEPWIMIDVYYHDWLSNPVMVKKHDGSWRMCVDFTDLNKACPQDCYPIQEIDWKVESLCDYLFKCFLDAYKGYHQIQLAESDEEKTAFHTGQGVYCYTKMPFGLKNTGATYQRLSDTEAEMLRDIGETFRTLQKINMKLNPKKYTFGEVEGMFLGYMITLKGIKLCPDKTEVVLQLSSPRIIKEVQSLNGKLASLNRFLFKSAGKSLPLFKTLKKCIKKSDFHWTSEAEQAFKQLKQHLSELPLLVAPKPREELIVYLSASYGAISAGLKTKRGMVQTAVYFISRVLQGPELNYNLMEKLVLSLVFAAKRLRRTIIKIERHAGRTQYHIPAKDVGERTASNNEAEYEALKVGLQIATQMGVQIIHVSVDSKLVANQVLGAYVANEENMIKYLEKILVEILKEKSIQEKEVKTVVEEDGPTWMIPIMEYLKEGTLPSDKKEARKLQIGMTTYRTTAVDVVYNDEELRLNLDLLEERCECAVIREAKAKLKMTKYYNARVRGVTFRPGDFVYRSSNASHAVDGRKFGSKWEGPYEVTEALGDVAYKLRSADGTVLPRTWNVANLKKCYL